jgi:hypothetical protein
MPLFTKPHLYAHNVLCFRHGQQFFLAIRTVGMKEDFSAKEILFFTLGRLAFTLNKPKLAGNYLQTAPKYWLGQVSLDCVSNSCIDISFKIRRLGNIR